MLDLGILQEQAANLRRAIDLSDDHFRQMLMKQHLSVVTAMIAAIKEQSLRQPSSRERHRARKAAKNLAMHKTEGRRPWNCGQFGEVLDSLTRHLGDGQRLRESSGFAAMSRRANEAAWLRDQLAEYTRLSMATLFDEATP